MQLALPLSLPASRPLIPVEAAVVLLDRSEEEISAGIESGALSIAWDIGASSVRRSEVRIYRESLLAVLQGVPAPDPDQPIEERMFPGRDLRSTELRRWWSCSNNLIADLITGGYLRVAKPAAAPSGPNAYCLLDRASVLGFLRDRRIR